MSEINISDITTYKTSDRLPLNRGLEVISKKLIRECGSSVIPNLPNNPYVTVIFYIETPELSKIVSENNDAIFVYSNSKTKLFLEYHNYVPGCLSFRPVE